MSHIACNEKDISSYLDLIRNKGCCKDVLFEILDGIVPKSDKIDINIDISDEFGHAYFDSELGLVHINEEMLDEYVKKYSSDMIKMNSNLCSCSCDLYAYNLLYALIHEIEHVYQFMFAFGYLNPPYNVVGELYNKLFKYHLDDDMNGFVKEILLFKRMLYSRRVDFVLERNANVETCELLRRVCNYENNKEIFGSINYEYLLYLKLGYFKKKYNGSFEESFSKLWRKDLFSKEFLENISVEGRIRYGLPIDSKSRELLLRLE